MLSIKHLNRIKNNVKSLKKADKNLNIVLSTPLF